MTSRSNIDCGAQRLTAVGQIKKRVVGKLSGVIDSDSKIREQLEKNYITP